MDHIKYHYFASHRSINPTGIVRKGPEIDFMLCMGVKALLKELFLKLLLTLYQNRENHFRKGILKFHRVLNIVTQAIL